MSSRPQHKRYQISFAVSKEAAGLIERIAVRASQMYPHISMDHFCMDVTAVHANGTPLRLKALLDADDFNFAHDIAGIYRHLDRDNGSPTGGKCLNHFVPRFAE